MIVLHIFDDFGECQSRIRYNFIKFDQWSQGQASRYSF